MEMHFCRRCGQALTHQNDHIYRCPSGHTLFDNNAPSTLLILVNDQRQMALSIRAIDPGKGRLDLPGGFCNKGETFEDCVVPEINEECGLSTQDYTQPQFLTSRIDDYEFEGETLTVLTACFWAKLKPSVTLTPSDDIAKIQFISYEDLDPSALQWPDQIKVVDILHQQGIV